MTNTNTNNTTTTPNQPLRIAITGANGLVGSGLVALVLASGHAVLALDRAAKGLHPESEVYHYAQVDVSDYDAYKAEVAGWKCTAMVHLAAVFNAHDDEGNFTTQVGSHVSGCGMWVSGDMTIVFGSESRRLQEGGVKT